MRRMDPQQPWRRIRSVRSCSISASADPRQAARWRRSGYRGGITWLHVKNKLDIKFSCLDASSHQSELGAFIFFRAPMTPPLSTAAPPTIHVPPRLRSLASMEPEEIQSPIERPPHMPNDTNSLLSILQVHLEHRRLSRIWGLDVRNALPR